MSGAHAGRASYREVFADREFAALTGALVWSVVGDQLTRVAVSVLVYTRTGSPLLTAITFGISYVPWVVGGPLLSSLADRFPRRSVAVVCDLARMALVAALAIPHTPLVGLLVLLFVGQLFTPPFTAARAALQADVLTGDTYVVGSSVSTMILQLGQVLGFALGGAAVALVHVDGALLLDALTFALSALLITLGVRNRPAEPHAGGHRLLADTWDGLALVLGNRRLLTLVALAWLAPMFVYGGEGLMAPYAHHLHDGPRTVGLLLAAAPLGAVVGSWLIARLAPPRRLALVRPLALGSCLVLVPLLLDPPLPVVLTLLALAGAAMAYNLPLNAMFVQAVPPAFRGRAFGVASTGIEATQGLGVLGCGLAATVAVPPIVIACSGALGVLCLLPVLLTWNTAEDRELRLPRPGRHSRRVLDEAARG